MEIYINFTGKRSKPMPAPALMILTVFVVFLKTPAPGLMWSHKNLKCNQPSGLCRKAWKSDYSEGTKVSRKETIWFGGGRVYFLTPRYTFFSQSPFVQVARNIVRQFCLGKRGRRLEGDSLHAHLAARDPHFGFCRKGLILWNRDSCRQTNHLVHRKYWGKRGRIYNRLFGGKIKLLFTRSRSY